MYGCPYSYSVYTVTVYCTHTCIYMSQVDSEYIGMYICTKISHVYMYSHITSTISMQKGKVVTTCQACGLYKYIMHTLSTWTYIGILAKYWITLRRSSRLYSKCLSLAGKVMRLWPSFARPPERKQIFF